MSARLPLSVKSSFPRICLAKGRISLYQPATTATYEDNDDDDDDSQRNNDNSNDDCDYDSNRHTGLMRCRTAYKRNKTVIGRRLRPQCRHLEVTLSARKVGLCVRWPATGIIAHRL